jgi:triphosphoribosyl-dephospho-CoA synthase
MKDEAVTATDLAATLERACLLEAAAPKLGNVHPGAAFHDLAFKHFAVAARVSSRPLAKSDATGVGPAILEAARATRAATGTNPNLGILLLLGPLAASAAVSRAARPASTIARQLPQTLANMTTEDGRAVYEAIRVLQPGGLGETVDMDVQQVEQPPDLLMAMRAAAGRDRIARQYVTAFHDVFEQIVPMLEQARGNRPLARIADAHVQLLARWPDSLIERKCGRELAEQVRRMADKTLLIPDGPERLSALMELDCFLREDGNRRNPGTTADLIAAGLFVGLWESRGWMADTSAIDRELENAMARA